MKRWFGTRKGRMQRPRRSGGEPDVTGGGGGGTLSQDGSMLGSLGAEGAGARHPQGDPGQIRHGDRLVTPRITSPIGGDTGLSRDDAQRRETHPGIAGGASTSDFGASGRLGGDESGVGQGE